MGEAGAEGVVPLRHDGGLGDGGGGWVEVDGGTADEVGEGDFLFVFVEEAAVQGEVGGVALFLEDGGEALVDGIGGDHEVDGHVLGRGEAVDAVHALAVGVISPGEGGDDEVGGALETVPFPHGVDAGDEDGVLARFEIGGEGSALGVLDAAVEQEGGDGGGGERGLEGGGEFLEG